MTHVLRVNLNSGASIPVIGLGTAEFEPGAVARAKTWISMALKHGYRHIDTAAMYGTEGVVGEAIRESGIPRAEIFVTTKLPVCIDREHTVTGSLEKSLKKLGLEYVDLYLMHCPQTLFYEEGNTFPKNPDGTIKVVNEPTLNEKYAEMEQLLSTGKVKAIGVSNFSIKTLEKLFETAKVVPAANQVEMHPYLVQEELRDYCTKKGITIQAYSPSGFATVRGDPCIVDLASKYGVSPNQVILAWHVARGTLPVTKSTDENRQKENINLPTLTGEDVDKITALDRGQRISIKPDAHGQVLGWTLEKMGW